MRGKKRRSDDQSAVTFCLLSLKRKLILEQRKRARRLKLYADLSKSKCKSYGYRVDYELSREARIENRASN